MAIYDISENELNIAYDIFGNELDYAYDVFGNEVYSKGVEPVVPLNWDMPLSYKGQILSALDHIKSYKKSHNSAYAFVQFNDVHEVFGANEPNFIDYNKGYRILSRMIFIGDMLNTSTATTTPQAVAYMNGASASKKLVGMGNHEFFRSGGTHPEVAYKAALNAEITYMDTSESPQPLIFYSDDNDKNVRYIVLDYYHITQSGANTGHLLDLAQLAWCASVMESSGTKDIIIIGHAALTPFTIISTGAKKTTETGLQNQDKLKELINAYQDKETYSVTVSGTTHSYDFSDCTGNFVLYTCGHWHTLGYDNKNDFNMFTTPTLLSNGTSIGFTFFLVDPTEKTIEMMLCAKTTGQYKSYSYPYAWEKPVRRNGTIISFVAENAYSYIELSTDIVAIQSGSGDPSSENVRPISGFTDVKITRTGVNLFGGDVLKDGVKYSLSSATIDEETKTVTYLANATVTRTGFTRLCGLSGKFKENTRYTFIFTYAKTSTSSKGSNIRLYYTDGDYENFPQHSSGTTKGTYVVVSKANKTVESIRKFYSSGTTIIYYDECCVLEGVHTADDFVAFNGDTYSADWTEEAGTIYGGSFDAIKGILTVTHENIASYDGETINEPWISSMDVYESGATPTTGAQVVYPLSSPQTYQLELFEGNTFIGQNNIWGSANGETYIAYYK